MKQNPPDDVFEIVNKLGVFAIGRIWVLEATKDSLLVNVVRIGNGFFRQIYSALNFTNSYLIVKRLLEAGDGCHDYWRLVRSKAKI